MIKTIATFLIFGKPLVVYVGILTLLSFTGTALIAVLNNRGFNKIPFKWHPRMAKISLAIAAIHAIFAISLFL